jgi:predicted ester cyclase
MKIGIIDSVKMGGGLVAAIGQSTDTTSLGRRFMLILAGVNGASAVEEVLSETFVAYLPYIRYAVRGKEDFVAQMKEFRSAFSHLQCDIDEVIDDGMRVAVRCTWRGTHTGELLGIAATHRKIEFTETHLLRIFDGRITEDHVSANLTHLVHQLDAAQFGMLPRFSRYTFPCQEFPRGA